MKIEGFETAAISLHGVQGATISRIHGISSRNVPASGRYSTGIFLLPYLRFLEDSRSEIKFKGLSADQIAGRLRSVLSEFTAHRLSGAPLGEEARDLFYLSDGVTDGGAYGIVINGDGVAVNGFPSASATSLPSRNVSISDVNIERVEGSSVEVVSLRSASRAIINDPVGSILRIASIGPRGRPLSISSSAHSEATYVGTAVTDAQLLIAKAALAGEFPAYLDVSRSTIPSEVVQWAEGTDTLANLLSNGFSWTCQTDQMAHVMKGVIGFKLDGVSGLTAKRLAAKVTNLGGPGSTLCGDYEISHPKAVLPGYGGDVARGMSVAGSSSVTIEELEVDVTALVGDSIGIDVLTDSSDVSIEGVQVSGSATTPVIKVRISEGAERVSSLDGG